MEKDRQWPAFSEAAGAHGIESSWALPLVAGHDGVGALNFYSRVTEAFDDGDVELGLQFATQAASVLATSQAYWDVHHLSQDMTTALNSRTTIEQAKGILMGARGCNTEEVLQILVRASQRENRKLREIAEEMVAQAARDATAARPAPPATLSRSLGIEPPEDSEREAVESLRLARGAGGIVPRVIRRSTRASDDLAAVVADECRRGGFHDASVLMADLEQRVLNPLPPVPDGLGVQEVDTSVAGRAFQLERPVGAHRDGALADDATILFVDWHP